MAFGEKDILKEKIGELKNYLVELDVVAEYVDESPLTLKTKTSIFSAILDDQTETEDDITELESKLSRLNKWW